MSEQDKCAACGRDDLNLKKCAACKTVKYCGIACQKQHRSTHKAECRKQAAILHDEILFQQPSMEDCSICCLPISIGVTNASYHMCCGKEICQGCMFRVRKDNNTKDSCPFCRAEMEVSSSEELKRVKHRIDMKDPDAFIILGWFYYNGSHDLTADGVKAFDLWLKAADLGSAEANNNIANLYLEGRGVKSDIKKAFTYWEKAAIGGCNAARHNLATYEEGNNGNIQRSLKHLMISASGGLNESMLTIREHYRRGNVSKEYYESVSQAHKTTLDQIWSEQRIEAAAYYDRDSMVPPA